MPFSGFKQKSGFRKSFKTEGTPLQRRLHFGGKQSTESRNSSNVLRDSGGEDGPSQWDFSSFMFLQFQDPTRGDPLGFSNSSADLHLILKYIGIPTRLYASSFMNAMDQRHLQRQRCLSYARRTQQAKV